MKTIPQAVFPADDGVSVPLRRYNFKPGEDLENYR